MVFDFLPFKIERHHLSPQLWNDSLVTTDWTQSTFVSIEKCWESMHVSRAQQAHSCLWNYFDCVFLLKSNRNSSLKGKIISSSVIGSRGVWYTLLTRRDDTQYWVHKNKIFLTLFSRNLVMTVLLVMNVSSVLLAECKVAQDLVTLLIGSAQ